jgi:hypothetical protein
MRARYVTARQKDLHTVHRQPCRQQQEDAGLAQEEPHGSVGEGDLTSQLRCMQPFGLFCMGRL